MKTMLRLTPHAFVMFAMTLLVACAQFGQNKPQTPEDNLRYAQAVQTGIYTTLSSSVKDGTMTPTQARSIFNKMEPGSKAIDEADKVLVLTGGQIPADNVEKIRLALVVLTEIANQLRTSLPAAKTTALPAPR